MLTLRSEREGKRMIEIIAGLLLIVGSFFALIASIGIIRLPDVYSRMHSASKAGTVGSGLMMIALAITAESSGTSIRAIAGVFFFILTAPIAAHLLARAAYKVGYPLWEHSVADEMKKSSER
jgi:multicomponent Na+:H+ antiporter subunit G